MTIQLRNANACSKEAEEWQHCTPKTQGVPLRKAPARLPIADGEVFTEVLFQVHPFFLYRCLGFTANSIRFSLISTPTFGRAGDVVQLVEA
jgi:hypothetical protein